jgi:hypothetical protein
MHNFCIGAVRYFYSFSQFAQAGEWEAPAAQTDRGFPTTMGIDKPS